MDTSANKKNVKAYLSQKAFEIAKKEVEDEHKYQWETVSDIARVRVEMNTLDYLVAAIVEYLEEL